MPSFQNHLRGIADDAGYYAATLKDVLSVRGWNPLLHIFPAVAIGALAVVQMASQTFNAMRERAEESAR